MGGSSSRPSSDSVPALPESSSVASSDAKDNGADESPVDEDPDEATSEPMTSIVPTASSSALSDVAVTDSVFPSLDSTIDQMQIDSQVSQQFVIDMTSSTSDPAGSTPEVGLTNEQQPGKLQTSGMPLIAPSNPDLTPWVAICDWEERSHWFRRMDLVEFHRGLIFSHWGIYMGDGMIAHVTSYDLLNGSSNILRTLTGVSALLPSVTKHPSVATASIFGGIAITLGEMILKPSPPPDSTNSGPGLYFHRIDSIALVAADSQFRVNNLVHRAKDHIVRSWEETFHLVHSRVNQVHHYCLRSNNCEHVASGFRYKAKELTGRPAKKAKK